MKRVELKTEIIKMLLSKNKITMLELSKYLEIQPSLITKYVNNSVACPLDMANSIAIFLGTNLENILKNSNIEESTTEIKSNEYTHHLLQIWKTFDIKDKLRFLLKAIKFSEKIKERNKDNA